MQSGQHPDVGSTLPVHAVGSTALEFVGREGFSNDGDCGDFVISWI